MTPKRTLPWTRANLLRAGVTPDEIRLVNGYRGLMAEQKEAVLTLISHAILANAEADAQRPASGKEGTR